MLRGSVLSDGSCGDCGKTTKETYLEILEFTHFVDFFSFNRLEENHKEKVLVNKVTVVVALDLGTGNTKILDYESEYRAINTLIEDRDTCSRVSLFFYTKF